MAERHAAVLAELAELNLMAARELTTGLAEAGTPEAKASFALALGRVSRSIRQCVALEARLTRDARREVRQDEAQVVSLEKARVDRRKAQVKATVERIVRLEHETDEAEDLLEQFDLLLEEDSLAEGFTAEPAQAQVARLCEELGLSVPPPQGEGDHEVVEGASAQASPPQFQGGSPIAGFAGAPSEGERQSPSSA